MSNPKKPPNPPITKITDQLYLGDGEASRDREILKEHNITAVVSLSEGPWTHWHMPWYKEIIIDGNHLFLYCDDSMTMDLLVELARICDFIRQHLNPGRVLIHCNQGVSRSATAMIAYLMHENQYNLDTALALVKEKRKIRPNKNFMEQLEVWGKVEGNIWSAPDVPKPEYAAYLEKRKERLKEAGLTGDEPIGIRSL
jgi:protein-tyrosine phosphatase